MDDNERCPDCHHKMIAHSERGCDIGIRTTEGITPCPCQRRRSVKSANKERTMPRFVILGTPGGGDVRDLIFDMIDEQLRVDECVRLDCSDTDDDHDHWLDGPKRYD